MGCLKKEELLENILNLNEKAPFQIEIGEDTDIVITNEASNKEWCTDKKKTLFTARMLLSQEEKTVYYWELLKEGVSGIEFNGSSVKKKVKGKQLFRNIREKGFNSSGKIVYDYEFDYESSREAFQNLVEDAEWKFKLVLMKRKTSYS